jgi:uncharacterized RDD family membrane protein YckC
MLWFPLLLIFLTPLRQRIGDLAAGTTVVTDHPIKEKADRDEEE